MDRLCMGMLAGGALFLAAALASAQNAVPVSMVSTKAPGTSSTPATAVKSMNGLETQARSVDRDTQAIALARLETMMKKGPLSTADQATAYNALSDLALSGTVRPTISGMTVINSYPDIRMMACRLLGELGGPRASQTLLRVLFNDNEPTVLSEAAFQLGRMGKNPDNRVTEAIVWALARQDARSLDNNLAFSSLLAFESLAKANHGLTDVGVYDIIGRIQGEDYTGTVKQKAAQVLAELRSYN